MSDMRNSRYGPSNGPKPRTSSFHTRANCRYDLKCHRQDCYFAHPKRDAIRESRKYEDNTTTMYGRGESYRPGPPLKPLDTNIGYSPGPESAPLTRTELRAPSRPPQDDGARNRRRGSSVARSSTPISHDTDRSSTPQRDDIANAPREVAKNDATATMPTGDKMEVDPPAVEQPAQHKEREEAVQTNGAALEPVVMATEDGQQANDIKQTRRSEGVHETETYLSAQRQPSSDVLLETDPRLRQLRSSEDSEFEAMSFADVLSWVIKVRIQINEVETRKRHIRNNLLSYEKTIERDQHEGKGSIWQETYEAERAKLQQIENEHQDLSRRLKTGFSKIATLTSNTLENTASTAMEGQENEALRKENESLREKLEDHSKSIQALQIQLQEMRSSKLMTKDDAVKATGPLVFRLERLEGTVTKTLDSKLQQETDYNKAALDQHDTNIGVQQELRVLKDGFSDVSGQLSTLANQQTETSALFQSIDAKLQNSLKEFADFTADIPQRIQYLEGLLKRKTIGVDAGAFGGDIAERAVASPERSIGTSDIGERTSALEVQLYSLRQRLDGFTMDQHLKNIINAIQQIWHPQSGALIQRLDMVEHNSRNMVRSHGEWAKTMEAAIKSKAEGADLTQLREILNETLSSSTNSQELVKELSSALTENQVRHKSTRQELDAINTSVARIKTLQDENKAKFEKFVSEFEIALVQQTQGDSIRNEIINSSSNNLNDLLSRVKELEQRIRPRSDIKPRNNVQPRPDIMSLDSDDTSGGPISPPRPARLPSDTKPRSGTKSRSDTRSRNDDRPRSEVMSLDSDDTSRGPASPQEAKAPRGMGSFNPKGALKRMAPEDSERRRGNRKFS